MSVEKSNSKMKRLLKKIAKENNININDDPEDVTGCLLVHNDIVDKRVWKIYCEKENLISKNIPTIRKSNTKKYLFFLDDLYEWIEDCANTLCQD